MRIGRVILVMILAAGVFVVFFVTPPGGRTSPFDPDRLGALETESWRALEARSDLRVFWANVRFLRELHRYPWSRAISAGFYRTRAVTTVANRPNRFEVVLPDLEAAFATEQAWREAAFDPAHAARAELRWWAARRTPALNPAGQVAELMAEELALRYGSAVPEMRAAALSRTEALRLLDDGGEFPDWQAVEARLTSAYRSLLDAITAAERRRQR
jgi:hypothetical protein